MEPTKMQRFRIGFVGGTVGAFVYKMMDGIWTDDFVFAEQGTQLMIRSLVVALVFGATLGLMNILLKMWPSKMIK